MNTTKSSGKKRFGKIPEPLLVLIIIALFGLVYLFGYQLRPPVGNDYYRDMKELLSKEPATSYEITTVEKDSPILIVAPYGGKTVLYTSTISRGIAGDTFNLFDFSGRLDTGNYERLHISSVSYNAPVLEAMNKKAQITLSVSGNTSEDNRLTYIGGLDEEGSVLVRNALRSAGFDAELAPSEFQGKDPKNFVNRNANGAGIQLVITQRQRKALFNNTRESEPNDRFDRYVKAISDALNELAKSRAASP